MKWVTRRQIRVNRTATDSFSAISTDQRALYFWLNSGSTAFFYSLNHFNPFSFGFGPRLRRDALRKSGRAKRV